MSLGIIQEPQVGSFVVIRIEGSSWVRYGTITEVTDRWIHLEGYHYTRSGWILRERLVECYRPSSIRIPISVYDH